MTKKPFIFLALLAFFSCENSSTQVQNTAEVNQNQKRTAVSFTDVIPNDVDDSSKVRIINQLVFNISADSTLVTIETKDSLNTPVYGVYRNDSLVKIIRGTGPISSDLYSPEVKGFGEGYAYTAYYFFMDSLIYSRRQCRSISPRTGSCNPVYILVDSYYYNGEVIAETVDDQIGQYGDCGCGMPPNVLNQKDKQARVAESYENINQWKGLLETAKKS